MQPQGMPAIALPIDPPLLADAAQLSSLPDETPEGRSIVVLAKEKYGLRGRELSSHECKFVPFSAQTRMSGVDLNGFEIRKGATDAIANYVAQNGHHLPDEVRKIVEEISMLGGTPLVVAERNRGALGVIELKDIVKGGMKERFDQLRSIGIRTAISRSSTSQRLLRLRGSPSIHRLKRPGRWRERGHQVQRDLPTQLSRVPRLRSAS